MRWYGVYSTINQDTFDALRLPIEPVAECPPCPEGVEAGWCADEDEREDAYECPDEKPGDECYVDWTTEEESEPEVIEEELPEEEEPIEEESEPNTKVEEG